MSRAASQRFYRNMAKVVNRGETLDDQRDVACVLVRNAVVLLQECNDFDALYLSGRADSLLSVAITTLTPLKPLQ